MYPALAAAAWGGLTGTGKAYHRSLGDGDVAGVNRGVVKLNPGQVGIAASTRILFTTRTNEKCVELLLAPVDIEKILAELRSQQKLIGETIVALERIRDNARVRDIESEGQFNAKTPRHFSAEARRRMAEGQRKRWAAARKQHEALD